jgi:hypothetical protein
MKSLLLLAAALTFASPLAAAAPPSPVGTWEIALAGADHGTAYVTFEADQDFTAYGLSRGSYALFTLSGTWSVDGTGQLSGNYTESINGATETG